MKHICCSWESWVAALFKGFVSKCYPNFDDVILLHGLVYRTMLVYAVSFGGSTTWLIEECGKRNLTCNKYLSTAVSKHLTFSSFGYFSFYSLVESRVWEQSSLFWGGAGKALILPKRVVKQKKHWQSSSLILWIINLEYLKKTSNFC